MLASAFSFSTPRKFNDISGSDGTNRSALIRKCLQIPTSAFRRLRLRDALKGKVTGCCVGSALYCNTALPL